MLSLFLVKGGGHNFTGLACWFLNNILNSKKKRENMLLLKLIKNRLQEETQFEIVSFNVSGQ